MKKSNWRPRITVDPTSVDALFGPFNRPSCMTKKSADEPPPPPGSFPPPLEMELPGPVTEPPVEDPSLGQLYEFDAGPDQSDSERPTLPTTDVVPPVIEEPPGPLDPGGQQHMEMLGTPDPTPYDPAVLAKAEKSIPKGMARPMATSALIPDSFLYGDMDNEVFDAQVTSGDQKPWDALETHRQELIKYLTDATSTGVHATPESPAVGVGLGHTTDAVRQDATNELLRIHMIQKARKLRMSLGTDTPVYPQQIAAAADKFVKQFKVDGVIGNEEVKTIAKHNDEISAMLAQAPDASGFGKVKDFLQDRSPLELGLLMVGIPLALIGLFGAISGEGGFGSFMALLLGGAATAAGLGAFGRFKKTKPSIPSATAAGPAGLHKGRGVESMVMLYDSTSDAEHRSGGLKALDSKLRLDAQRPGPGGALEPQLRKLYTALHGTTTDKLLAKHSPLTMQGTLNPLHGLDEAGIVAYAAQQMGVTPPVAERFLIMYGHLLRYRRDNPRYKTAPQSEAAAQP